MKWWYEPEEEEMKVYKNEDLCIECKNAFFSKPYDHRDPTPGTIGYCVHCDNCLIKDKEKKMEFQKERCFTALNADELKQGDKVLAADDLASLKDKIRDMKVNTIYRICPENCSSRFINEYGNDYALAYLVERKENCTNCGNRGNSYCSCFTRDKSDDELSRTVCDNYIRLSEQKAEPHYRPFANTDELIRVWCEKAKATPPILDMPHIWVRNKSDRKVWLINEFDKRILDYLFTNCEFLDGSPCGVEE